MRNKSSRVNRWRSSRSSNSGKIISFQSRSSPVFCQVSSRAAISTASPLPIEPNVHGSVLPPGDVAPVCAPLSRVECFAYVRRTAQRWKEARRVGRELVDRHSSDPAHPGTIHHDLQGGDASGPLASRDRLARTKPEPFAPYPSPCFTNSLNASCDSPTIA